jgi:hypothetical protein
MGQSSKAMSKEEGGSSEIKSLSLSLWRELLVYLRRIDMISFMEQEGVSHGLSGEGGPEERQSV